MGGVPHPDKKASDEETRLTTRLSLVIPAYNEADRLSTGLSRLLDGLPPDDTEILVIDDGSTDQTAKVAAEQLAHWPQYSVTSLARNSGKGAAVRAGVVRARGDVIAFVDADMETDPRDLGELVRTLKNNDVAVGSRTHESSTVNDRSSHRAMMTRTFGLVVAQIMHLPMGDTQCGFKAFKGSIAKLLFPRQSRGSVCLRCRGPKSCCSIGPEDSRGSGPLDRSGRKSYPTVSRRRTDDGRCRPYPPNLANPTSDAGAFLARGADRCCHFSYSTVHSERKPRDQLEGRYCHSLPLRSSDDGPSHL